LDHGVSDTSVATAGTCITEDQVRRNRFKARFLHANLWVVLKVGKVNNWEVGKERRGHGIIGRVTKENR